MLTAFFLSSAIFLTSGETALPDPCDDGNPKALDQLISELKIDKKIISVKKHVKKETAADGSVKEKTCVWSIEHERKPVRSGKSGDEGPR